MARFEVRVVNRDVLVSVDSAASAYRWLDQNARDGDTYTIEAIDSDGTRRPVVQGDW
jgi:hypothetical protein